MLDGTSVHQFIFAVALVRIMVCGDMLASMLQTLGLYWLGAGPREGLCVWISLGKMGETLLVQGYNA